MLSTLRAAVGPAHLANSKEAIPRVSSAAAAPCQGRMLLKASSCCSSTLPIAASRAQQLSPHQLPRAVASRHIATMAADTSTVQPASSEPAYTPAERTKICTSVTAKTVPACLEEIKEAEAAGVDLIELRLDFIEGFDAARDLLPLMQACGVPYIVTYRPVWEGGNYDGPEATRLATLKYATLSGAPYVDVELLAAPVFFAGAGEVPISTKVILSSHNFSETPSAEELAKRAAEMWAAGADIVKLAAMANDVADAATMLTLLRDQRGPTIALSMGERGVVTRLLAAKYGGYLTFAALDGGRASAPGQPSVAALRGLYNFGAQSKDTKAYGIVGNPVSHSKSPAIHNAAFRAIGYDGVYVPLLVDDLPRFLAAFEPLRAFSGLSVTIPHKGAALAAAARPDAVCAAIGACNTLVRVEEEDHSGGDASTSGSSSERPFGPYAGYNTDWLAAITAIERGLEAASTSGNNASPLAGRTFVVVGAGGAGRALAFGAASRGATVLVANRNAARAEQLAASVPGGAARAVDWADLQAGRVAGDVLANTTSVGMTPDVDATPVPAAALAAAGYALVFDAVYTPRETRLLRDAAAAGAATVDGVEMFVGQAVEQFRLFTGGADAPVDVMEAALLGSS